MTCLVNTVLHLHQYNNWINLACHISYVFTTAFSVTQATRNRNGWRGKAILFKGSQLPLLPILYESFSSFLIDKNTNTYITLVRTPCSQNIYWKLLQVELLIKILSTLQLNKTRVGNDRYAERWMNTFNEPPKLKSVQTTRITYNVS